MLLRPKVEVIKAKREALGLSQHQLTVLSGLSWGSVSRIESGQTKRISSLRGKELAKTLRCRLEDICEFPQGTV